MNLTNLTDQELFRYVDLSDPTIGEIVSRAQMLFAIIHDIQNICDRDLPAKMIIEEIKDLCLEI